MATVDKDSTNDIVLAEGETIEEIKEYITNPDGTVTIKTTKVITSMEETDEEEEQEENNKQGTNATKAIKANGTKAEEEEDDDAKYGADGLGQLTKEEVEEFMLLQAERKWLDSMGGGGAPEKQQNGGQHDTQDKPKKKKKKPEEGGEKKGKKKKRRGGDGKENNKSPDLGSGASSNETSEDSDDQFSSEDKNLRKKSTENGNIEHSEFTIEKQTTDISFEQLVMSKSEYKNGYLEENSEIKFEALPLQNGGKRHSMDRDENRGEILDNQNKNFNEKLSDEVFQKQGTDFNLHNSVEDEGIVIQENVTLNSTVSVERLRHGESSLSSVDSVTVDTDLQSSSVHIRDQEDISSNTENSKDLVSNGEDFGNLSLNNESLIDVCSKEEELANLASPDEDLAEIVSNDDDLDVYMDSSVAKEENTADEEMTEEENQMELDRTEGDDELYSIDVKKLAVSFLSSKEGHSSTSPHPPIDDLPDNLPKISDLVESYKNSPVKAADMSQPSDIPSGLSLKSMKSAYEANTVKSSDQSTTSAAEEEGLQLSFSQMRAAYCSVVNQSTPATSQGSSTNGKSDNIKQLRASYGDLTAITDSVDLATFTAMQEPSQVSSSCRSCSKQVFQMEKIVAEKASWHKNCFRCNECNKNLTLETYQSHEGVLYCKPHFKELFRPKAVVEDPTEARKERLLRRPKMIVLESNPDILPDDVVRSTSKPDYGLEELSSLNMKQRFSMFETAGQDDEERKLEPVAVRRSQSMINRAARFLKDNSEDQEFGVDNCELGEHDEEEEETDEDEEGSEEEVEEEDGVDENGEPIIVKTTRKKKKMRQESFNSTGELKDQQEKQTRRDRMTKIRKEELGRFRQMLCAGKNVSLKERFESGQFENDENKKGLEKEEIKIDEKRAARSLKAKFEQGQPFTLDDDENEINGNRQGTEIQEVEEIFKDAETANKARNLFKQIDSKANEDGSAVLMRSQSFASTNKDNRRSMNISSQLSPPPTGDIVRCHDKIEEDAQPETTDLASKFMFFATFEDRAKEDAEKTKKAFSITPPREGTSQGLDQEDIELGRDPNLIKCTDNYQDEVDCRNTRSILNMFKKMEQRTCGVGEGEEEEESEGEYEEDYSEDGEEYTDDDEEGEEYSGEEEDEDMEGEEGGENKSKYKDELLQMSAKKAAQLRAKFEKWEAEEKRRNDINKSSNGVVDEEEAMPSLDTARNLKAMFEEKMQEAAKPLVRERTKVNRFV